jgi:HAE1 family hydrophobic/amphiphilic exporter-1
MDMEFSGTSEEMESSFTSLGYALALAAALVYMVMASQFESLIHPFIVMFSVPFAAIGLVGALLATGTTFNLVAFVGAILLVGIVVNNAIVLVDYMNTLRRRGMGLREAVIHGGKTRLKPILMTSLTTILGLLPMAIGWGTGSELRAPMGRAVVGGLTTSTLITLILIPTLYWMVESKLEARRHAKEHAQARRHVHRGSAP